MAQVFFGIEKGLEIDGRAIIVGTGAPGAGDSATVPVGSIYVQDTGVLWAKITSGSGVDKWAKQASESSVTSIVNALGVRKAVRVATVAALPAHTASGSGVGKTLTMNAVGIVTVDGEAVTAANGWAVGDRMLVRSEATSHPDHGIYTVTTLSDVTTALVLTRATDADESSEMTDGQFVVVGEGTQAGKAFVLTTDNPITIDSTALEYARFGADVDAELSAIQSFIGKSPGSDTPDYSSNTYVTDGSSLETAIGALDAQLTTVTARLDRERTEVDFANITTSTVVDSVLVDNVAAVRWEIVARGVSVGHETWKFVSEVQAAHDGHAAADATAATNMTFTKMRVGFSSQNEPVFTVDVSGTGASQVVRLLCSSGTATVSGRVLRHVML